MSKQNVTEYFKTPGGDLNLVLGGSFRFGPFPFNVQIFDSYVSMLANNFDVLLGFGHGTALDSPGIKVYRYNENDELLGDLFEMDILTTFDFLSLADGNPVSSKNASQPDAMHIRTTAGQPYSYLPAGHYSELVLPSLTTRVLVFYWRVMAKEI